MRTTALTLKQPISVWIASAILLALAVMPVHAARGADVRVAVASNFIAPLEALSKTFETATGHHLVISAGSTGKLYAQIHNGAPFDVFMAANASEPQRLEAEGAAVAGSRFTYALGRLALWCRSAQSSEAARACLDQDAYRLAIASPRLAPYGQAAEETMAALGKTDMSRIVTGENIAQAFQLVWSGNVDAGFVALSQIRARDDLTGAYWIVPSDLHTPIDQQAVLLKSAEHNDAAKDFLAFLRTSGASATVAAFGYDTQAQLAETK